MVSAMEALEGLIIRQPCMDFTLQGRNDPLMKVSSAKFTSITACYSMCLFWYMNPTGTCLKAHYARA